MREVCGFFFFFGRGRWKDHRPAFHTMRQTPFSVFVMDPPQCQIALD